MTIGAGKMKLEAGNTVSVTVQITDKMVRQFAEMCGDFNPIHLDDEYAKTTRFKRRIAHGMIAGALFSRVLNDSLGSGGIYLSQSIKFVNPIFIDETIAIEIKITAMRKEKGIATAETIARNVATGEICVKGEAMIMVATAPGVGS